MKKLFFLAVILFAVSASFGQNNQNVSPEKPIPNGPIMLMPQANCPVPPVAVYVTQNNNSFPSVPTQPKAKCKRYHGYSNNRWSNTWDNTWGVPTPRGLLSMPSNGSISGSFNTTTNNNNYYQEVPVKESWCNVCEKYGPQHAHAVYSSQPTNWDPLIWFVALAGLMILTFLMADWYRKRHPIVPVTVATPATPTIVRTPAPTVIIPPSADEVEKAMTAAKDSGVSFTRSSNGVGYSIDFPKPESKKGEDVKHQ